MSTRAERMDSALDFLLSYKARYGYFPQGQSLARFLMTGDEVARVWALARTAARDAEPALSDPRPDSRTHPDYWTE